MGAQQKADGHMAEHNLGLHNYIKDYFNLNEVKPLGASNTKTDIIGFDDTTTLRFSVKYATGKNTQTWLPTLKSLCEQVRELKPHQDKLQQFFGTDNRALFESWIKNATPTLNETYRQRLGSDKIAGWNQVLESFNTATGNHNLLKPMIMAKGSEAPVNFLIWIDKKKGGITFVDVNKLVNYIAENSNWSNSLSTRGQYYNLWCTDVNTGKRLFHLQMKGSGTSDYHAPMFHIHRNWPKELIIHENSNFQLR